jgi:predicted enzyme related to lactoylglutathione lyase
MTTRDHAPTGAPCWTDLWTSDVEGSRRFYTELFGWEALEPSAEFGGYFMFARNGMPTAGGMGDMGDMKANNTWKVYLHTDDADRVVKEVTSQGGEVQGPAMPVADLGTQAVFTDPTGAPLGTWQPGTFPGFLVLGEHGAPSWFELVTNDFAKALDFYQSCFRWETTMISDTDEFRYAVMRNPDGDGELAGIMDSSSLPGSPASAWSVYWHVDDVASTLGTLKKLGGSVVDDAADTPYGTLATAKDPFGAEFKLRTAPS